MMSLNTLGIMDKTLKVTALQALNNSIVRNFYNILENAVKVLNKCQKNCNIHTIRARQELLSAAI
jgi:hypothetical protein